jgi:DNA polymerase-3 subunit alpha
LRKILREHPGGSLVFLHLGTHQVLQLADEFSVDLDRVIGELRVAFGHDAVML